MLEVRSEDLPVRHEGVVSGPFTASVRGAVPPTASTGIARNGKKGWRATINIVVHVPGLGGCQRHVISYWPGDTPFEVMAAWRASEKPKLEQHWADHFAAAEAERERLLAEVKRLTEQAAALKPVRGRPVNANGPTAVAAVALAEQLKDALHKNAEQARTIFRLQQAVSAAERRAELAEAATRRAYAGFASAAGARR